MATTSVVGLFVLGPDRETAQRLFQEADRDWVEHAEGCGPCAHGDTCERGALLLGVLDHYEAFQRNVCGGFEETTYGPSEQELIDMEEWDTYGAH